MSSITNRSPGFIDRRVYRGITNTTEEEFLQTIHTGNSSEISALLRASIGNDQLRLCLNDDDLKTAFQRMSAVAISNLLRALIRNDQLRLILHYYVFLNLAFERMSAGAIPARLRELIRNDQQQHFLNDTQNSYYTNQHLPNPLEAAISHAVQGNYLQQHLLNNTDVLFSAFGRMPSGAIPDLLRTLAGNDQLRFLLMNIYVLGAAFKRMPRAEIFSLLHELLGNEQLQPFLNNPHVLYPAFKRMPTRRLLVLFHELLENDQLRLFSNDTIDTDDTNHTDCLYPVLKRISAGAIPDLLRAFIGNDHLRFLLKNDFVLVKAFKRMPKAEIFPLLHELLENEQLRNFLCRHFQRCYELIPILNQLIELMVNRRLCFPRWRPLLWALFLMNNDVLVTAFQRIPTGAIPDLLNALIGNEQLRPCLNDIDVLRSAFQLLPREEIFPLLRELIENEQYRSFLDDPNVLFPAFLRMPVAQIPEFLAIPELRTLGFPRQNPLRELLPVFSNYPRLVERTNLLRGFLDRLPQIPNETHSAAVHSSVNESLYKLQNTYQLSDENVTSCLNEITGYLSHSIAGIDETTRLSALTCFDETLLVTYCDSTTSYNDRTFSMREILALVWRGIIDPDALGLDGQSSPLNLEEIEERKRAFVNHLFQIQNEDGLNRPACIGGGINKLVESLDGIHRDVHIKRFSPELFNNLITEVVADRFNNRSQEDRDQLQQENINDSNGFFDECRRVILERAQALGAELRNDGLYVQNPDIQVLTRDAYVRTICNEILGYAIPHPDQSLSRS